MKRRTPWRRAASSKCSVYRTFVSMNSAGARYEYGIGTSAARCTTMSTPSTVRLDQEGVADVAGAHLEAPRRRVDQMSEPRPIAARVVVDERAHRRALVQQRLGEMAPDEAAGPGDQNAASAEIFRQRLLLLAIAARRIPPALRGSNDVRGHVAGRASELKNFSRRDAEAQRKKGRSWICLSSAPRRLRAKNFLRRVLR